MITVAQNATAVNNYGDGDEKSLEKAGRGFHIRDVFYRTVKNS
jgi:hypothetical protein